MQKKPAAAEDAKPIEKPAGAKGLDGILALKPGEPLGRNNAQAIMDQCERLKDQGWGFPMQEYRGLKGHHTKRDFGMKLAMDRSGAWLRVVEESSLASEAEKSLVQGWLHLWEAPRTYVYTSNDTNDSVPKKY